mmetsp:Transcript_26273/g.78786  ORF Transcript_26273/g.78786 Transcript_26273/m.78786 type:complete len:189 (-) Transcript_26273:20-586(-)
MRFRFCGGLTVPAWVLHEIQALSEISSVRLKLLAKQVLHQALHGTMDYQKVLRFATPKGAEPDLPATEGIVAAVNFFVSSGVKYGVDDDTFLKEMEQLGLPRENASAILRPYRDAKAALRAKFAAGTFKVSATKPLDFARAGDDVVALRLADPDVAVAMSVDKFEVFRHDMQGVAAVMARWDDPAGGE